PRWPAGGGPRGRWRPPGPGLRRNRVGPAAAPAGPTLLGVGPRSRPVASAPIMPIVGSEPPHGTWTAQQQAEDLVVSTPERVSFTYDTATLGSRFLAQFLDLLVLAGGAGVISAGFVAVLSAAPHLQAAQPW